MKILQIDALIYQRCISNDALIGIIDALIYALVLICNQSIRCLLMCINAFLKMASVVKMIREKVWYEYGLCLRRFYCCIWACINHRKFSNSFKQ